MNITHYYFDFSNSLALKNKLQNDAFQYLKTLKNTVINASDLEQAKEEILKQLQQINQNNRRCRAQDFSWWQRDNYISLSGFYEVSFIIKPGELKHMSRIAYQSLSNN